MTDDETPGLYIHIPFCQTKCNYCGFSSSTALGQVPDFLQALKREIDIYRHDFSSFDTIYLGGGTPSVLPINDLAAILESITRTFNISQHAEITIEANPGDLTLPLLLELRHIGINRLNLGIQSFDDATLKFLGRRHNRKDAVNAIEIAQMTGFDNLGIDLMYATPGQDLTTWTNTLNQALLFQPAHLSCYQLTIEPETPFAINHREGELLLPDAERQADFFFHTATILQKAGYLHYEVSNFARDAASLSRHNQKYWRHTPYLGLGPAAHSFRDSRRWWNHRDIVCYIDALQLNVTPVASEEALTPAELRLERLFLGLRTRKGIDLENFRARYGCDLLVEKKTAIEHLIHEGLLEITDGCLRPTLSGMAVADSLALI